MSGLYHTEKLCFSTANGETDSSLDCAKIGNQNYAQSCGKVIQNDWGKKTAEQNLIIIFSLNSTNWRIAEAPQKIMPDFVWETPDSKKMTVFLQ